MTPVNPAEPPPAAAARQVWAAAWVAAASSQFPQTFQALVAAVLIHPFAGGGNVAAARPRAILT